MVVLTKSISLLLSKYPFVFLFIMKHFDKFDVILPLKPPPPQHPKCGATFGLRSLHTFFYQTEILHVYHICGC